MFSGGLDRTIKKYTIVIENVEYIQDIKSIMCKAVHTILTYFIAAVWLLNGLFCKVMNLVPRHQQIVAGILGDKYSRHLTILIGLSEIIMAIWILIRVKARLNAIAQIIIIATMNILEYILVPDLLLWGKFNVVFAFLLIIIIYYNEFYLHRPV